MDVQFEKVVFSEQQEGAANLDDASTASLHANGDATRESGDPKKTPCSPEWRANIMEWRDGITLPD